ncbi:MAG: histidinol-phosphate transaminase, partial [Thermodesulfobacteriota bacterium]|nr:histidinol-phosphate transaminase [Thermodesulfobacteriota bacterium]
YFLRQAIAEKHYLDPDQVLLGNGANEVISFVIKAFCMEGDNIITAEKTFAVYEWVAEFSGFQAQLVPMKDFGFDDEGMLAKINERTKILFICNPNNPTGTYWPKDKLTGFLDKVDGRQIVVVDEAYFEFMEEEDYPDGVKLLRDYPNLVVFRTFSKMYGIAGLRIGYLIGNLDVVEIIRRTCVVYSVNSIAQEAALAALADPDHIDRTRALVNKERRYLQQEFGKLGLFSICNQANYVMVKLPMSDTLAYRKLMAKGVMVRSMTTFRFPNWLRISIGRHEAMEAFIKALTEILDGRAKNG